MTYVVCCAGYAIETDTSLLEVGKGEYLVQYDHLANGWNYPPGMWGTSDFTFSMRFTWAGVPQV